MKMQQMDGRHKLAVVIAIVFWALSMWFSYLGFSFENAELQWVGWILAAGVTVVELVFNTPTHKLSLTLIVIGVLCYVYGIYTNITGFWSLQHPSETMVFFTQRSMLSMIVGIILEILPEPLFMWGLGEFGKGDLLGNLMGLWNGQLPYSKPEVPQQSQQKKITPQMQNLPRQQPRPAYVPVMPVQPQNKQQRPQQGNPYPRQSAYVQAIQEMESDGEFDGAEPVSRWGG